MNDRTLRTLIAVVIGLLVLREFVDWSVEVLGAAIGVLGGVIVALVSFICGRLARVGVGNVAWFLIPTVLFSLVPTVARVWRFFTRDTSVGERIWDLMPFLLGFALPVLILLLNYVQLRLRGTSLRDSLRRGEPKPAAGE